MMNAPCKVIIYRSQDLINTELTSIDLLESPMGVHPVGIECLNQPVKSGRINHSAMDAYQGSPS